MAGLAAGLRFPHANQMAGSTDDHRSGAGDDVRRGSGVEQYSHSAAMTVVAGLAGVASLPDDEDSEDAEENRRRRMETVSNRGTKEVRVAQQYPIEEKNIINLQTIQHDKKPHKIIPKAETVSDAIPYNEKRCTGKQQNGDGFD